LKDNRSLSDRDVVNLLDRLKSVKSEYPADLKSRRRDLFLSSIATGAWLHTPNRINLSHGAEAPMTPVMKVVIVALATTAVTVTTALGVWVYENRSALNDVLSRKTQPVSYYSPIPSSTMTIPMTPTASPTGSATPTVIMTEEWTPIYSDSATPVPTDNRDNGKHIGQTPHPTKDQPGGP
jgi:hypothetical protein